MDGVAVGLREDGDCFDAETTTGANDTTGDLTAIGDENLVEILQSEREREGQEKGWRE